MKRRIRNSQLPLLVVLLALVLCGCIENSEGCLDPNAMNLNVDADINGGCTYPNLNLNLSHKWIKPPGGEGDTLNFRLRKDYVLDTGDTLVVNSFKYYFSNFRLGGISDLFVFDTVEAVDGEFFRDDLIIFDPAVFTVSIGEIRSFGQYDSIEFALGFDQEWNQVDTSLLANEESNHPWLEDVLIHEDDTRLCGVLNYSLINQDTLVNQWEITFEDKKKLTWEANTRIMQANDGVINFFIDYFALFKDINFRNGTVDSEKEKFRSNMEHAFRVIVE